MPNRKPSPVVQDLWDQAKDLCSICPVSRECRRDTVGEEYGVFGGLDQYERYKVRMALPEAVKHWPKERRLAWGKELQRMRAGGLHWATIQTQTGLIRAAAEPLVKEWLRENVKAAAGNIVDLPLPEPEREPMPFPEVPGSRHAWVRHRGLVSDAWYRGETYDGQWIYATTTAGKGQVNKWFPIKDVKIYRPQVAVILTYAKRQGNAAVKGVQDRCPQGHLFTKENTRVLTRGWRECRTCRREWDADRHRRKREEERATA